jgi:predicted amino acid dehydrogenase
VTVAVHETSGEENGHVARRSECGCIRASGAIASQVARRLAGEGAVVWLSARRGEAAKELTEKINASAEVRQRPVQDRPAE